MLRKAGAATILLLLLVVPFINWRVGALLWMCAWLTFIFQGLSRRRFFRGQQGNDGDGG